MYNVCTEEYTNLKCTASCIEKSGNSKSKWTHLITSQIKEENKKKQNRNHLTIKKKKRERESSDSSPEELLMCLMFVR